MPKYTCLKCGATGHSKNIATRSFFPSDQYASLLSNCVKVNSSRVVPKSCSGNDMPDMAYYEVTFSLKVYERTLLQENLPLESDEAEIRAIDMLQFPDNLEKVYGFSKEQTARNWLCNHKWHTDEEPDC